MWRLQYRNFGTHAALVTNHTIDVDGLDHAGVRWYELRRSDGGPWTIFQQGDFAPQDPASTSFLHRWMGSVAMDKEGNIALGFSASSSTLVPSVRYVGRRVTDPLGMLPQGNPPDGDLVIVNGAGSQFASRWGDYSSMSIDPVDECTFWYTQEYIGTDGRWRTRIGAFRFPSCDFVVVCDSNDPDAIKGTAGPDNLLGTPGDDVIFGLGGDDSIVGLDGNDCIDGGGGDDRIVSGPGNDQIAGRPGEDSIVSEEGADKVAAGSGNDRVVGGPGNDAIDGGPGEDVIVGGPGTDACINGEIVVNCE